MAFLSAYQYYDNGGATPSDANWGSYQYVSLQDIVTNYELMHVGNHEIVNHVNRYQILFHAKRAIQELNYDAFKEVKTLELNIDDQLRFVLPHDYVNWVRISLFKDGALLPMHENVQVNSARAYLQDNNYRIIIDEDGNVMEPEFSELNKARLSSDLLSPYLNTNSPYEGYEGYNIDGYWYFELPIGGRYGLNTETANVNPTFRIDNKAGVINFSSGIEGELCILEYISDGMEGGDDSLISVNKMFEDYIYAEITFRILSGKLGVQEYIVERVRRQRRALLRNAKIRMSNIHPGRLLMSLRGQNKWIK